MPDTAMGRRLAGDTSRHADFCQFSQSIGGPCQCGLEEAVNAVEREAAASAAAREAAYRGALRHIADGVDTDEDRHAERTPAGVAREALDESGVAGGRLP